MQQSVRNELNYFLEKKKEKSLQSHNALKMSHAKPIWRKL